MADLLSLFDVPEGEHRQPHPRAGTDQSRLCRRSDHHERHGPGRHGDGVGDGAQRATEAARLAISSPLLEESSIDGARGILLNVTGGRDIALHEVHDAASAIRQVAHDDARIIFGAVVDEKLGDDLQVTVIAAGFHHLEAEARRLAPGG